MAGGFSVITADDRGRWTYAPGAYTDSLGDAIGPFGYKDHADDIDNWDTPPPTKRRYVYGEWSEPLATTLGIDLHREIAPPANDVEIPPQETLPVPQKEAASTEPSTWPVPSSSHRLGCPCTACVNKRAKFFAKPSTPPVAPKRHHLPSCRCWACRLGAETRIGIKAVVDRAFTGIQTELDELRADPRDPGGIEAARKRYASSLDDYRWYLDMTSQR